MLTAGAWEEWKTLKTSTFPCAFITYELIEQYEKTKGSAELVSQYNCANKWIKNNQQVFSVDPKYVKVPGNVVMCTIPENIGFKIISKWHL